ncbi:YciI family protein [Hymenobacter crusticola]|uniref:YCII-related domain-containing protein n=1 Tax=Hymenobacter crusticola TaxID=1770526 RepID=A0A243WC38_9BACT|nr:YciI family protein [Hymenobacter crusticola]OUJ72946.1 hypothetical protein BXP70_16755 [Hymenobacter crusticola]
MNQYLITAYDYTDAGALARRLEARASHLEGAHQLRQTGNLLFGGAILNDDGQMIGSMMVVQFESLETLNAWKEQDPYVLQRVWEKVEIKPFRQAAV